MVIERIYYSIDVCSHICVSVCCDSRLRERLSFPIIATYTLVKRDTVLSSLTHSHLWFRFHWPNAWPKYIMVDRFCAHKTQEEEEEKRNNRDARRKRRTHIVMCLNCCVSVIVPLPLLKWICKAKVFKSLFFCLIPTLSLSLPLSRCLALQRPVRQQRRNVTFDIL